MNWNIAALPNFRHFFLSGLLALSCLSIVCSLWQQPLIVACALLALSAIMLSMGRSRLELAIFLLTLVLGSLAEIAAVGSGAWSYACEGCAIPVLLPLLWGIAGVFVLRLAAGLREAWQKR